MNGDRLAQGIVSAQVRECARVWKHGGTKGDILSRSWQEVRDRGLPPTKAELNIALKVLVRSGFVAKQRHQEPGRPPLVTYVVGNRARSL